MAEVVELDAMPAAAGLYARALAPTRRPNVTAALPDRSVRLAGHRSSVAEVAGYATVCGFGLADRLPATWLHVLSFPLQLTVLTAADFPLAPAGMVHVANSLTQFRPALITEALDLSVHAENLRPHRRGVLIDLVGTVHAGDDLVWQGRSTYLNRSARLPDAPEPASDTDPSPELDLPTAGLWRLPADLGRRYAAVSGDVNPIHLSALAARAFGFPRAIAHGMWTHARTLAALQSRLPDSYRADVRFGKPVLLPSTVRFAAAGSDGAYAARLSDRPGRRTFVSMTVGPAV